MSYMLWIAKEYMKFSSAHFTMFDDGREKLHGHNYQLSLEVESEELHDGFVVNFVPLKKAATEICKRLDEKILLPDSPRVSVETTEHTVKARFDGKDDFEFPTGDVIQIPISNITCEALAMMIADELIGIRDTWDEHHRIIRLRVWVQETPGQRGGCEMTL